MVNANISEQIEKTQRQLAGSVEEVTTFSKSNVEACTQAASILSSGLQDISQAIFNHMQASMQNAMNTSKALLGVKTMRDLVDLQTAYVKGTFDSLMSESTKLSEIAVRVSSQAAEPINARVSDVVEKISERVKKVA